MANASGVTEETQNISVICCCGRKRKPKNCREFFRYMYYRTNYKSKTKLGTVLFAARMTYHIGTLSINAYDYYYPRWVLGCRRRVQPHNFSLEEILSLLYSHIPTPGRLEDIITFSMRNAQQILPAFQEVLKCTTPMELFLTGSTIERFDAPNAPIFTAWSDKSDTKHALLSDFDFMVSPSTNAKASFFEGVRYLAISAADDGGNPSDKQYVYLLDNETNEFLNAEELKANLLKTVEKLYLKYIKRDARESLMSCQELKAAKKHVLKGYKSVEVKGPTLQVLLGKDPQDELMLEMTLAIQCDEWPAQISNWLERQKQWPNEIDQQRITSKGCLIVPKSRPREPKFYSFIISPGNYESTWRVSFSLAEVELSKLIPTIARMCYVGLKVIRKDYLELICNKLSSYHLKCIFLYVLETTAPEFWLDEQNIDVGFYLLLDRLILSLVDKDCPHFWIPCINLYEDFTDVETQKLIDKLIEIKKSPQNFIESIAEENRL